MLVDPETVQGLQERVGRALPAEHVEYVGDWWLRRSVSSSWWVGTVLPHGSAGREELMGGIAVAERFYADFGVATRFQISPGACPGDLDPVLAERGYRRHSPMSLRTASPEEVRARARPGGLRIQLNEVPTTAWFDVWYAVGGRGSDPRAEWDMLRRVDRPSVYASALRGDEVVAVGRSVVDDGWAGVFSMATLPRARGEGAARDVLVSLADWASSRGADGMYLQVDGGNDPALRLYGSTGFTEVCGYHYRG
ncbi:GNAT superfamily N-acetyltransferase [Saccharopolyspora lacisalsi]|uniref:GNAT superfamily N-acetyltransferase n=1 Tax=Halosaccharopolyspora lacisalsi TaxID=1000566 RepID=A0A839E1B1_9PSEU|nr:GNAT family N-acetyltransferase [Halosaccharopolyspora lacisalsi]MBA8826306.1 GNAT superfamily N-acetyltransferase [Halosaccharopolyspora lacisalsi]